MPLLTKLINVFFARRRKEIDFFMEHPQQVQQQQLKWLLNRAEIRFLDGSMDFRLSVPPRSLLLRSQLLITIHFRAISPGSAGEQNVLWPTEIKWFAKSSGTTSSKSKFIPVSHEGLQGGHMQGPRDVLRSLCPFVSAKPCF